MKSIIFIFLISNFANAQINCLKTTNENHVESFCDQTNNDHLYLLNCNSNQVCFSGNSDELVNQINSFDFTFRDGGLGEARIINNDQIEFYYGDVGSVCKKIAIRCQ